MITDNKTEVSKKKRKMVLVFITLFAEKTCCNHAIAGWVQLKKKELSKNKLFAIKWGIELISKQI